MTSPPPAACARCAHPNDPDALACSACGNYLLVDLRVEEAIADPRWRYHAAKAIASKGRPFPDLARASRDLQIRDAILVAGMSRAAAAASSEALAAVGVRTRITSAVPAAAASTLEGGGTAGRKSFGFDRLSPGLLLAIGALAAAFFILRAVLRPADKAPALVSGGEAGTGAPSAQASRDPHAAVNRALGATAMLSCGESAASGFFVAPDLLVTNHHATCGEGEGIRVAMQGGRTLTGRVMKSDPWLDLALVNAPGASAEPLSLGDATDIAVGDHVLAIGNPLGLGFTVTQGIVSHKERELLGVGYLQFDGNVNPGNSGGPLVDQEGNVVGVVAMMIRDSKGLSFAIPVNYLYEGPRPLLDEPPGKRHGQRWQEFLARMRTEENREVREVESAFSRPGLAAAAVQARSISAVVMRRSDSPPASEQMSFRLLGDGTPFCNAAGQVESWKQLEAGGKDTMADGRYIEWLRKHGIAAEIWVGVARIPWGGCPKPPEGAVVEVALEGADPHADRVMLRNGF